MTTVEHEGRFYVAEAVRRNRIVDGRRTGRKGAVLRYRYPSKDGRIHEGRLPDVAAKGYGYSRERDARKRGEQYD